MLVNKKIIDQINLFFIVKGNQIGFFFISIIEERKFNRIQGKINIQSILNSK